jgi:hypothetical protein
MRLQLLAPLGRSSCHNPNQKKNRGTRWTALGKHTPPGPNNQKRPGEKSTSSHTQHTSPSLTGKQRQGTTQPHIKHALAIFFLMMLGIDRNTIVPSSAKKAKKADASLPRTNRSMGQSVSQTVCGPSTGRSGAAVNAAGGFAHSQSSEQGQLGLYASKPKHHFAQHRDEANPGHHSHHGTVNDVPLPVHPRASLFLYLHLLPIFHVCVCRLPC